MLVKEFKKSIKQYKYLWLALFLSVFACVYFFPINFDPVNLGTNSKDFIKNPIGSTMRLIEAKAASKVKQTDGYTAGLILGIDSRNLKFEDGEFKGKDRNTDTIIQVIYDHENNNLFMISIPRDTGIEIDEECVNQGYDKAINRLYKIGQDSNCEKGGLDLVLDYSSEITGFENNYYALVSFDTFYQFFDVIGEEKDGEKGLTIDIPENVYEYYPATDYGYEYFELKSGKQFLDAEGLLRYARSRQNTSDFVRARRQQVVLETVKDRVLEIGVEDPTVIKDMYESFRDNALYSDITLDEIVGGLSLLTKLKEAELYNMVLDDTFGGQNNYISKPSFSTPGIHTRPGFYLSPVDYKDDCCSEDNYARVKSHIRSIVENPEVHDEQAKIAIYTNDAKFDNLEIEIQEWIDGGNPFNIAEKSKYPFKKDLGYDIVIVNISGESFPNTLEYLEDSFGSHQPKIMEQSETGITPAYKEDIAVIIQSN